MLLDEHQELRVVMGLWNLINVWFWELNNRKTKDNINWNRSLIYFVSGLYFIHDAYLIMYEQSYFVTFQLGHNLYLTYI